MSDESPFVLFICNDLFFGSKITNAAGPAGVRLVTDSSGSLESMSDAGCLGVILDLNHPNASPATVAKQAGDGLRLLAFGPHVRTELFEAAKAAGFETVTRGQFDRSTADVLRSFAS
jgi:hypothetical protein